MAIPGKTTHYSILFPVNNVLNAGSMMPVPATKATQLVAGEDVSISPVSQTSSESGVSVLTRYKKYLKSCYKARPLAAADKYLPTLSAPYINLAMVSREDCGPEQRDEFTRQTLHGGVDQILKSKTPINIKDLLTPEDSDGKPVRFVLVEGAPGIGKSTFAWEACRKWDEIESLRDYQTLVLLKLREKWVLNATKPYDLFRFPPEPEFSKNIFNAISKSHGQNLLLILDGFDEVSHSFHENSVVKSILCRQLLPESTIILTTRPSAKSTLKSICQPRVDKHVEIIGFTEEERVRYITEVFSKEPELQANFLKYMFHVPHIKSMMYIPLNCAIIAQVYYESQKSCQLTIPKTKTQLYNALTHSLLVRHMKMKEEYHESMSVLPEGLKQNDREMFNTLAKFAFSSYHEGVSKKVTFFKEDIPKGLVHFGFMNESSEMYAGTGVERTFSFLHLSLQEYLAAWHLASSYSIEFQVAYHMLAVTKNISDYGGVIEEEKALFSSLQPLKESLVEPAIFLAGITGMRCQSEDDRNPWEIYRSHTTADYVRLHRVLSRSLYEAQNPTAISHYFTTSSRQRVQIDSSLTPYDCYSLSYCLANASNRVSLHISIQSDNDVSLVETFVKGLNDHCKYTTPKVQRLSVINYTESVESFNMGLFWLTKSQFLTAIEEIEMELSTAMDSGTLHTFLQSVPKLKTLAFQVVSPTSWEWLTALKSLSELKVLHIVSYYEEYSSPPPTVPLCWLIENRLTELELNIELPPNEMHELHSSTDLLVDSILQSVIRSNHITKIVLPNVCRETMAGVHSILLHCPSLTRLELKRTRLGYDGILYICSALRKNKTLISLIIDDDMQLAQLRKDRKWDNSISSLISMKRVPLPSKTTCTDFLLELNNILKENTTLEGMKIQSGLFLPLSADGEYCQWTGLGPLQQFNVGAVASGMSPNLRRSFSSSDLTQPQTQLFWETWFILSEQEPKEIDFKKLLSKRKEEGKKLCSLPSFTAPDTAVLQSFSGLDPRLKACLGISRLHQYVERLREAYWGMLGGILYSQL